MSLLLNTCYSSWQQQQQQQHNNNNIVIRIADEPLFPKKNMAKTFSTTKIKRFVY
jgi:hypothetical protein